MRKLSILFLPLFFATLLEGRMAHATGEGSNQTGETAKQENHLRILPEFLVSFPQPLELGAELQLAPESPLRIYVDGGYFVFPISGGAGHFKEASFQSGVRYFPGNKWFFGLVGLGYRYVGLTEDTSAFKIDDEVIATSGAIGMHTLFARLAVGAQFRVSRRILLGSDVGYQFPLLAAARMTLIDSNTGQSSNDSSVLAVNSGGFVRIARLGLPEITLLRLTVQLD